MVNLYATNKIQPPIPVLYQIADILNVDVRELLLPNKQPNRKDIMIRTEDEIRDSAKKILGFDEKEPNIKQGTGQITTFNQLGFKGISDKPDGWYLPSDTQDVARICLHDDALTGF